MRRWLIVSGIAVVVIVAAVALAAANLDAYLNSHRGAVQERLEAELGREVSFGAVGISFLPGLGVRVEDLRVGDDAAFSEGDFVRAAAVDVGVKLLPALLETLQVFREHGINLTRLESRPIPGRPWEYLFYVDQAGRPGRDVLRKLRRHTTRLKVLGVYPAA